MQHSVDSKVEVTKLNLHVERIMLAVAIKVTVHTPDYMVVVISCIKLVKEVEPNVDGEMAMQVNEINFSVGTIMH